MKVKSKKRLLNELAKSVSTPWEFMEIIAALEGMKLPDALRMCGMSVQGYYTSKNQDSMGIQIGLKFSTGFGLDPNIFNHIIADYNLKKLIERQSTEESDT